MKLLVSLVTVLFATAAHAEWTVDLSRRSEDLKKIEMEALVPKNPIAKIFDKEQPKEEIVIANTDKGFVPATVRLKKDQIYQISVVNVNKNKKNASFMLDAFAEHHGTYFGDVVTFTVKPQKEGLFQFYSPESEYIGKVLVYGGEDSSLAPLPAVKIRAPASVDNDDDSTDVVVRGGNE